MVDQTQQLAVRMIGHPLCKELNGFCLFTLIFCPISENVVFVSFFLFLLWFAQPVAVGPKNGWCFISCGCFSTVIFV